MNLSIFTVKYLNITKTFSSQNNNNPPGEFDATTALKYFSAQQFPLHQMWPLFSKVHYSNLKHLKKFK